MQHTVSSTFQFINVPMGVWIDERGRVVRPAEPAWSTNSEMKIGAKSIVTEGEKYVAALRDWVANVSDTFYIIGSAAGPHPYVGDDRLFPVDGHRDMWGCVLVSD